MINLNITKKDVCCEMKNFPPKIQSDRFSDGTEYSDKKKVQSTTVLLKM